MYPNLALFLGTALLVKRQYPLSQISIRGLLTLTY